MKKLYGVIALCLLILALVLPALASDSEKTNGGSAIVGNATPTVTNPMLHNSPGTSDLNNTNVDVNTEYHVNCTIGDGNSLLDILNITYYIYDSGAVAYNAADANATHYTFLYLNSTDVWSEVGPGPSNIHIVTGSCTQPGTKTTTSGEYHLAIKLALRADYTATKVWKIRIDVFDLANDTASLETLVFGVNAYYLLTMIDPTHEWAGLVSPSDNNTLTTPVNNIDLQLTANRQYQLEAKGSGDLDDGSGHTIALENVRFHKDTLADATNMTVGYLDIGGHTGIAASEATTKEVWLWISVPAGMPPGTYIYTLTIQAKADP
jgi:hypothetical protein